MDLSTLLAPDEATLTILDPSTPHGIFIFAALCLGSFAAYVKRRVLVEWQLRTWTGDHDTYAWNLAHALHSLPILAKTYDVTQEYAPLVPHRTLVADPAPLMAKPSDATLPRDFYERLDGRRSHVTVTGRRLPPPKRDAASELDSTVGNYMKAGQWKLGLAAVEHLERRRSSVSAVDADLAVQGLLRAGRRHQALSLVTEKYADVPMPPATLAQLMRCFAKNEESHARRLLRHIDTTGVQLGAHAELAGSVLGVLSAYDWEGALAMFQTMSPAAAAATSPLPTVNIDNEDRQQQQPLVSSKSLDDSHGAYQAFVRNVGHCALRADPTRSDSFDVPRGQQLERSEALRRLLRHIRSALPNEYAPSVASVLHTTVGQQLASDLVQQQPHGTDIGPSPSTASHAVSRDAATALAVALAQREPSVPTSVAVCNYLIRHQPKAAATSVVASVEASPDPNAVLKAIARPVHNMGTWTAATALARYGIRSRRCDAVPALSSTVATRGHWALALKLCTQGMTIRRTPPSVQELGLCVHASVLAGRWAAALFWVERAHARGMRFSPAVYDAAFSATAGTKWAASLRAYKGMAEVGGACTEAGVRALLHGHAQQQKVEATIDVIAATDNVQWER